jgi:hypothetical protein
MKYRGFTCIIVAYDCSSIRVLICTEPHTIKLKTDLMEILKFESSFVILSIIEAAIAYANLFGIKGFVVVV